MVEFEESYFEPSLEYGFYVSAGMKRAWASNLECLAALDSVCERLGITYYIDYGTLLGAARHKGFIPWDDDVDVCMFRKDYLRLIEEAPSLLPEGMHIDCYRTSETHCVPNAALINRRDIGEDEQVTERYHGCPFITGMDIFPLDSIPSESEKHEEMMLYYSIFYDGGQRFNELRDNGELDGIIKQIEDVLEIHFDDSIDLRRQFYLEAEKIAMEFVQDEESELIAYLPDVACEGSVYERRREWYEETTRIPFGGLMVNAPAGFEEVLSHYYGEDYMTHFVKDGAGHTYPFYAKQMEYLKKRDPKGARKILSIAPGGDWGSSTLLDSQKDEIKKTVSNLIEVTQVMKDTQSPETGIEGEWQDILADCQQVAVEVGETVEANIEKPRPLILLFELYCEALYQCSIGECDAGQLLRILGDIMEAAEELPT